MSKKPVSLSRGGGHHRKAPVDDEPDDELDEPAFHDVGESKPENKPMSSKQATTEKRLTEEEIAERTAEKLKADEEKSKKVREQLDSENEETKAAAEAQKEEDERFAKEQEEKRKAEQEQRVAQAGGSPQGPRG